jgi:hypothetical protein
LGGLPERIGHDYVPLHGTTFEFFWAKTASFRLQAEPIQSARGYAILGECTAPVNVSVSWSLAWMFELVTLIALEIIMIFQSRPGWWRKLGLGPVTCVLIICTFLATFPLTDDILERIFFFFSHHWEWFALGTVAVFVFRTVGKHAAEIEVS